jgi:isopentenyl-diphosphate Delta-isomerase
VIEGGDRASILEERVILVDPSDSPLGTAEKLEAHRRGLLHRALSVVVVNPLGQVLMQRRAAGKYHSAGLWANTCCSHPRPGEPTEDAARRRLLQEMGVECDVEPVGSVLYRAPVGHDLIEHEYDHVFLGRWEGTPRPDPEEVQAWRWVDPAELRRALRHRPDRFAAWVEAVLLTAHGHGETSDPGAGRR